MLKTIGRKLGIGFGSLRVLTGASAIVVYVMTNNLVNKAIPVDVNCNRLAEGIDSSLSAVPAYVIVGGEEFKEQYEIARTEIDTALEKLNTLSEHGKGFAVVASEVKSLAEQSKKATLQVRQILGEIQQATNTAVLSTEQGTKAVAKANEVVAQAGDTINTLTQTLSKSARSATQISAAATQQATGVEQLNVGIKNIDTVTRENMQAIKQIEKSTNNLHSLSIELGSLTA